RYAAGLLGVLGVIALLLSAVGIYGVVSQWVLRRLRELGIRAALGARQRQLVGLVLSRGLRPVGVGAALGVALVLAHGPALRAGPLGAAAGASPPLGCSHGAPHRRGHCRLSASCPPRGEERSSARPPGRVNRGSPVDFRVKPVVSSPTCPRR